MAQLAALSSSAPGWDKAYGLPAVLSLFPLGGLAVPPLAKELGVLLPQPLSAESNPTHLLASFLARCLHQETPHRGSNGRKE